MGGCLSPVDRIGLENQHRLTPIGSSNLSPPAINKRKSSKTDNALD